MGAKVMDEAKESISKRINKYETKQALVIEKRKRQIGKKVAIKEEQKREMKKKIRKATRQVKKAKAKASKTTNTAIKDATVDPARIAKKELIKSAKLTLEKDQARRQARKEAERSQTVKQERRVLARNVKRAQSAMVEASSKGDKKAYTKASNQ